MKITQFEGYVLRAPDTGRPHWVSHFIVPRANELLVRMRTDEGVEGIGLATSYGPVGPPSHAFRSGIAELILGADPLAPERLYQKLFALTSQRLAHEKGWSREALVRISSAVDIAAWDIVGKAAGLPLYRLFGGYRSEVPCYVTCAYYRDGKTLAELRDEMQMLKAQGHTGFKAKAGRPRRSREDMERLALVREVIGPDNGSHGRRQPRLGPGHGARRQRACSSRCGRAGWRSRCAGSTTAASSSCSRRGRASPCPQAKAS